MKKIYVNGEINHFVIQNSGFKLEKVEYCFAADFEGYDLSDFQTVSEWIDTSKKGFSEKKVTHVSLERITYEWNKETDKFNETGTLDFVENREEEQDRLNGDPSNIGDALLTREEIPKQIIIAWDTVNDFLKSKWKS